METNQYLRYSEAFKLEVIQEVEAGMNLTQVGKRYGASTCGVRRWLGKNGKNHFLSNVVRVVTLKDTDRERPYEGVRKREATAGIGAGANAAQSDCARRNDPSGRSDVQG